MERARATDRGPWPKSKTTWAHGPQQEKNIMAIKAPGGDSNVFQKLYNATVTAQQQTFVKGGGAVLGNHLGRAAGGAVGTAVATAITIEAAKLTQEQAKAAVDTFNLMKEQGHSNLAAGWQTVPEAAFTAGFAVGTGLAALAIP